MPRVIVAGVPQRTARRLRAHLRAERSGIRAGWEVEVHKGVGKSTDPNVDALRKALQSEEWGGAHVLSFGDQNTRKQVVRDLIPYSRLRWLRGNLLGYVQAAMFDPIVEHLNAELEIEEAWAAELRPTHPRDALLLPAQSFSHDKKGDIWTAAEIATDEARISAAASKIETFGTYHFVDVPGKGRRWVDADGLVFDHTGEHHGVAMLSRQWKYAYRIPDGFHYDVTSKDGRAFSVIDHARAPHTRGAGAHANVDPYGYVR